MANIIINLPEKDVETLIHALKIAIGHSPTGITSIKSFRDLLDKVKKKTVQEIITEDWVTTNHYEQGKLVKITKEPRKQIKGNSETGHNCGENCKFFDKIYTHEGVCKLESDQSKGFDKVNNYWNKYCKEYTPRNSEPEYKIEALIEHDILENPRSEIIGIEEKQGYWLTLNDKRVLVFLDELWNKLCYWTHISPILSELEAVVERLKESFKNLGDLFDVYGNPIDKTEILEGN